MAIEKTYLLGKNITLGCGFDLQAKAPLDSRQVVPEYDGLQALIDGNAAYEGMIVYDEGTKKTYQAQLVDGVLAFREFGINEAELKALIVSETTAAMEFKGAATALPENPSKGDFYKVTTSFDVADGETAKIGDSIVYDGEQWFIIPSGDDIEDTWRPVTGVDNDATLTFEAGDKLEKTVAADGTITYKHVSIDAPTATPVGEDEQTRTYIASIETDGHGHITGYKTATENVEDTNTEYTFEGQSDEATSVYFQVTSNEEGASAEVIYLDAYSKNEADGKFVAKETGKSLVSDDEIARLAEVDNYDDEEVRGLIGDNAKAIEDLEEYVGTVPTDDKYKDLSVVAYINKKAEETLAAAQGGSSETAASVKQQLDNYKSENDTRVKAVEDDIDAINNADTGILKQAKDYADGLAGNYDEKGAAAGVQTALEAEIAKKVAKTDYEADKATFATKTELGDVDKKFENYRTSADQDVIDNGHKERIEALEAKFTGDNSVDAKIAAAVDAEKQRAEGIEGGLRTDVNAVAGRMDTAEGKITALETESAKHALKTEVEAVDAKFADYVTSASYATDKQSTETALADRYTKEEADGKFALIADAYDDTELVGRVAALETESAKHAVKTEVDAALDLKADKSVVEAMYTNEQIDGFIADAKKYADDNDANTTYTIGYESKVDGEGGHPARIVLTPSEGEAQYIDATPFIKDSVLDNVTYDADTNTLTFTFNTDAGKEAVTVELTDILAPYTGSTGDRVKIEVTDGVISADLVAGSIGKDYLDESVKASLALADSAIQSHQDISHLATTEALNGVDAKFANYTNTTDMNAKFDIKADKTQVATDIATAKSGAEAEAARLDGVLKSELQGEINTKANTADVYAKTETFTKDEVNAAISAAVEAAHTWGEF